VTIFLFSVPKSVKGNISFPKQKKVKICCTVLRSNTCGGDEFNMEYDRCNLCCRSESFANDAQILDKLNRIKLGLPNDAGSLNGRVAPIPEGRGDSDKLHVTKPSTNR
jgi:hypothetical protein